VDIKNGLYIQLVNRSTSRIIFSAATDELSPEAFQRLRKVVGDGIYKGLKAEVGQCNYYELRVEPIIGEHPSQQR
jgi:hypothetical protein